MYTNADSLLNKLDELKSKILKYDLVAITEVKPKHTVGVVWNSVLNITGYDCFLNAGFDKQGRGVCIYVKSSLSPYSVNIPGCEQFNESV